MASHSGRKRPSDYPFSIGQQFYDGPVNRFKIAEADVRATVGSPDQTEVLKLDEKTDSYFFMKRCGNKHVLVFCMVHDEVLVADFALKLYEDLTPDFSDKTPLDLVRIVANRFGIPVRIGRRKGLFILQETIPLAEGGVQILNVEPPPMRNMPSFVVQSLVMVEGSGRMRSARCALAYCIDVDTYVKWLDSHSTGR